MKRDAGSSSERDTLHGLAVMRGLILAAMLLLLAAPLATLFQSPEAITAFQWLAICPLLRSFCHLGVKELTRDYVFGPDAVSTILFHASVTLFTLIFTLIFRSYWSVVLGLIVGHIIFVWVTHILAPQSWRMGFNRETAREAFKYGAPLVPNGIAQGLRNIGDRLIVGAMLGPSMLGLYSVAVMIGVMPRGIILRYATTVLMPRFVNVGHGPQAYPLTGAFAVVLGLVAGFVNIGLWSFAAPVIKLVFGAAYAPSEQLVGAIAVMVSVKLMFAVVSLPAIAFGATTLVLIGSVGSLVGIGLGALSLYVAPDLVRFIYVVAIVDGIALIISLYVGRDVVSLRPVIVPVSTLAPVILLALLAAVSERLTQASFLDRMGAFASFSFLLLAAAEVMMRFAGSSLLAEVRILTSKPKQSEKGEDDK